MKFCPKCGNKLEGYWKVCPKCGEKLQDIPSEKPTPEKEEVTPKKKTGGSRKKGILLAFVILFAVVVVAAIALFLLFGSSGNEDSVELVCDLESIRVGNRCCPDLNFNRICDSDEEETSTSSILPTSSITSTSAITSTVAEETSTTIQQAVPENPNAVCSRDVDCGTIQYRCYGNYFCKDGSVYRNCRIDICHQPGTDGAFCAKGAKDVLISQCGDGEICEEGKRVCMKTNFVCTYPDRQAPADAVVLKAGKAYGDPVQDHAFKLRSRANDDNRCLTKAYIYMKTPVGIEDTAEVTWDKAGVFAGQHMGVGLISVVDDEQVYIWVSFPE